MSSRSASAFAAELGIVRDSTSCTHGCTPATQSTAIGYYPYSATAVLIMDQLLLHANRIEEDPTTLLPATGVFIELMRTTTACVDPNLVNSLIMIGTDILHGTSHDDKKGFIAEQLMYVIFHIEEFWRHTLSIVQNPQPHVEHRIEISLEDYSSLVCNVVQEVVKLKVDCVTKVVLFFDSRNPCSCLDQAKEQHKVAMVACWNTDCSKVTRETKLLLCSRCRTATFCSKACQVTHWPEHKKNCKKKQAALTEPKQKK